VDTARTYIFVRLWEDFPDDLDISKFEGVLRPDFGIQLDRVAAAWMRANLNGPKSDIIEAWAAEQPEPEPEFVALIEQDVCERIGITYLLHAIKHERSPQHPRWSLIHAEQTLDRAYALAEAVEGKMRVGCRFEIALEERSTLKPAVWLNYERELEEWDRRHSDIREVGFGAVPFKSPLRRLREEALKLSPHLGPAPVRSLPAPTASSTSLKPKSERHAKRSAPASGTAEAGNPKDRHPATRKERKKSPRKHHAAPRKKRSPASTVSSAARDRTPGSWREAGKHLITFRAFMRLIGKEGSGWTRSAKMLANPTWQAPRASLYRVADLLAAVQQAGQVEVDKLIFPRPALRRLLPPDHEPRWADRATVRPRAASKSRL
jgi:hypothetical protein